MNTKHTSYDRDIYLTDKYLPDGTELPWDYANFDGIIYQYTGEFQGPLYLIEE